MKHQNHIEQFIEGFSQNNANRLCAKNLPIKRGKDPDDALTTEEELMENLNTSQN